MISLLLQFFNINILYIIYWTELSAIQEVDSQGKSDTQIDNKSDKCTLSSFCDLCINSLHQHFSGDIETLLDGNVDQCYTGKLH